MDEFSNLRRVWLPALAILCALLILPVVRHSLHGWVYPDSLSYLDMATGAISESPLVLLRNAYWSPGFPALLAAAMVVARPSLDSELHTMYVVQWLIFVFAAVCLGWMALNLFRHARRHSWPELGEDAGLWRALLSFLFAWFLFLNKTPIIWFLTPDMLLQAMVYLAAGLALRLFLPATGWRHSALLGIALGVGYLVKAAMFPVALILTGILFLHPPKDLLGRRHLAVALLCFAITASPLVISLSLEKNRLTFGDAGKLNYVFVVTRLGPFSGWIGQDPENGVPAHAPRVLSRTPMVLEFRDPVRGTIPIWYDPSYWWEGVRVPLTLEVQMRGILRPFRLVHSKTSLLLAVMALLAPLCLLNRRVRQSVLADRVVLWLMITWPLLACLMYAMVLFSIRYLVGYMVLLGVGAALVALQAFPAAVKRRALWSATVLLTAGFAARSIPLVKEMVSPAPPVRFSVEEDRDSAHTAGVIARGLHAMGLRPGDEIAAVGHGLDAYYARLAGVRVVAQIWEDPAQMVNLDAAEVQRILGLLKQSGVKALLSRTAKPGFRNDEGWVPIPETNVCVRLL